MAIANGNDSARSKHLDALATAAKRYVLEEILDVSEAVSAELENINSIEYIVGTQTASTGAWTGVTKDTSLYAGKVIIYKLPYASSGNATLNLTFPNGTKSGAKNIYRYSSTRLTTQYAANYYIPLVFNGTYWFAFADYDTNYYDRIRVNNSVAVADGAIQAVCFVASSDGTHYKQLSAGSSFNINYPVFYNASAVADDANLSTGLYFAIGSVNLQSLLNDSNRTFDTQKPLYLKGTLNGNIFTVHSDLITTSVPSSTDGFTYIRLGFTYSSYQAYISLFDLKLFTFTNGSFSEVSSFALNMPTASSSVKGGIIIGDGFFLEGDTLNVNFSSISSTLNSIESKIDSISGGSSHAKSTPSLSLGAWTKSGSTFSATISYDGDGVLSSSLGSISGSTLTISDQDGSFNGTISASEGNSFAPASLYFSYSTVSSSPPAKATPSLSIDTTDIGNGCDGIISYNGDGHVYANTDNPYFGISIDDNYCVYLHRAPNAEEYTSCNTSCNVTFYASEGTNYSAASISAELDYGNWW